MHSHPLHTILAGKSIYLHSDGLYENQIRLNGDYCMRIDMESMTMSDIIVYAQHKIARARHKIKKIQKELSRYTSSERITNKLAKIKKSNAKRQKERPLSTTLSTDYDIDFELQYVVLAQELLQQVTVHFPNKITTYRLVDSIRTLIKKHKLVCIDTSYSLKLNQACKERLYALDNKSHIVDLCAVYDILTDIIDVSEHFKPYNMSYGTIQVDVGGICFWVCDQDEYENLSPTKQEILAEQSYLIDIECLATENLWYTVYLYLPSYLDRVKQDSQSILSIEEEHLCQSLSHKAIRECIQQLNLESVSCYCGMVVQ